jgi:hypothetical protein
MPKVAIQNGYNEVVFKINWTQKNKKNQCVVPFLINKRKYSEFRYIEDANLGLWFSIWIYLYDDDDKIVDLGCAAGIDCFIMADRITNKVQLPA